MVREITSTLVPAGVLFAAVFSVGTTFLAASLTGSPAMTPGADGAFATPTGFVIELTLPLAWVFGTCAIPVAHGLQLLSGTGLGGAASAAKGKVTGGVKKAGSKAAGKLGVGGAAGGTASTAGSSTATTTRSGRTLQDAAPSTAATGGETSVTTDAADTPDNPTASPIVADGGGDYTRPGGGQQYLDPDREYTKDHAIAEANHEMADEDFWGRPDDGLSHTFDDATTEEIERRDQRAKELYLQKGSDVTLDDIETAEDWKQLNHDQKQEIQYRQLEALQDTGNDYVSAAASDTLKTGMKMAGGAIGFAVGGVGGAAAGALAFSAIQGAAGQGASAFARNHQEHGSIRKATTETVRDFGDQMQTTWNEYADRGGDTDTTTASDAVDDHDKY